jgi:MoaA/NifB/PqqE/SkfB family radical SAM enzyme
MKKEWKNPDWFPAHGNNACLLKWSQVTLSLWDNTSSSCHRNGMAQIPNDFDFHNSPKWQEHRKKMLDGKWPSDGWGCEHCRDQEAIGGTSDRMQWLSNEYNKRYVPKELKDNPFATKIKPTQVSMHFNNKCNLKCVYCGPQYSSAWVKEIEQHEPENPKIQHFKKLETTYKERLEKFYVWMEENYQSLKAFDLLGGEPFIQTETWDCVDWMIKHPNPDCDIEIYSNMEVKPVLFKRGCEKLKELSKTVNEVVFVISVDCFGPESEYIRFPHNWKVMEENINYLIYECPEIIPTMNWTVTNLSLKQTPALVRKVIEWNKHRNVSVNYNRCHDPHFFDPKIMPEGFYDDTLDELRELNQIMYGKDKGPYMDYVETIFKEITETPADYDAIKMLKWRLTELDKRRGTDWQKTFPWLTTLGHNQ